MRRSIAARPLLACNLFKLRVACILYGLNGVSSRLARFDRRYICTVLRRYGAEIADNADVETGLTIHNASGDFSNLKVEEDCHIGKEVMLDLRGPVHIRAGSTISMRTIILTHMDVGRNALLREHYADYSAGMEIGPSAYIGAGSILLPGIRVGEGAVIGAGAVVNRSIEDLSVAVGVPARVIRRLPGMGDKKRLCR